MTDETLVRQAGKHSQSDVNAGGLSVSLLGHVHVPDAAFARLPCPACGEAWLTGPSDQIAPSQVLPGQVLPVRRHDPTTHDCRGGVKGDRFPY